MIRLRVVRLARQYHNPSLPPQRFDILYFGRDEFSCQVFDKLYTATGCGNSVVRVPTERVVWQMYGTTFSSRPSRIK